MEYVLKKYHTSETEHEKTYLIYDPMKNHPKISNAVLKSIFQRNFGQNCDHLLIGPFIEKQGYSAKAYDYHGNEIELDAGAMKIFSCYLQDQGYAVAQELQMECTAHAYGTVYCYIS